jgi:hypothetical protein
MARVTSERIRQFFVKPAAAPAEGITPDSIELFNPDGTPYSGGSGSGGMNWQSVWDVDADYVLNDVVKHDGHLYIAIDEAPSGIATPDNRVDIPDASGLEGDADPITTAIALTDDTAVFPDTGTTEVYFFDLSTGGTITLTGIDGADVSDIYMYDSDGETVGDTYLSPAATYEVTGLAIGRHYILITRADEDPGVVQFTAVPSAGAVLVAPVNNWELML